LSSPAAPASSPTDRNIDPADHPPRVLVLTADNLRLAIPASAAQTVLPTPTVSRLPGAVELVYGVVSVRGTLVPLVDAACLEGAVTARGRRWIVLVEHQGRCCALAVDELPELCSATIDAGDTRRCESRRFVGRVNTSAGDFPMLNVELLMDDLLLQ
jgi:chemotaxis signal transduction protein